MDRLSTEDVLGREFRGGFRRAAATAREAFSDPDALAGLCRQLASELGPDGVRVAWLLSPGSPDAPDAGGAGTGGGRSGDDADGPLVPATMLGRGPTLAEVANVAVFLASDWAAAMTATEVNLTAGAVVD